MTFEIILALAGLALLFELYVSIRVIRCKELEPVQKIVQVCLVWLIPLITAIGILIFINSIEKDDDPKGSKEFGGGPRNSVSSADAFLGSD